MIDSNVHILPGVDDGAIDEEQAIYMLEQAKADGITHWIITPHLNHESSHYTYETLRQQYDDWFQAYGEIYAGGNLIFGMEVFIDASFLENLDKMSRLPTFENSHYMLIEFETHWIYEQIMAAIVRLKTYGVVPILAHIETYPDLEDVSKVKMLSEEGVLIQLTASSFMNKSYQKFIRALFSMNAVDLIASDGHDTSSRPPILSEAYKFVERYYSKAWANRLFLETPMKVFYGEHYIRPLSIVKLRKSYRISMGVSVAFGLTLMAMGISQMSNQQSERIAESEITITEEAIPAGFSSLMTYDEVIASGNAQLLEIQRQYEAELSAIHDLIISAHDEIPNLKQRISKIDDYLSDAINLELQFDANVLKLLDEIEEDLEINGFSTGAIEGFKSEYASFKEAIKNKYSMMF